jgi:hypothetical protein
MTKNPQTYPLRYVEDFFGVSNEVAVKLSECATGNHFSPPCSGVFVAIYGGIVQYELKLRGF